MRIFVEEFNKTTPKEIIESRINVYLKKGKQIKTEIRENKIALYYIDNDEG